MTLATDFVAVSAQLACLLEASAEKPGNVTPTHSFADMSYEDFLRSAAAIGPEMARAGDRDVGQTILASVEATRLWTQTNTNLGIILLFAPLAKAASSRLVGQGGRWQVAGGRWQRPQRAQSSRGELRSTLKKVLRDLTVADAEAAYKAIQLAEPGGFEESVEHDVRSGPTVTFREAMASAVDRDNIAAEYLTDYEITFERGLPLLERAVREPPLHREPPLQQAIVQVYLELLAAIPDTLISRKHGRSVAEAVSRDAARVLALGGIYSQEGREAIAKFDGKLRKERSGLNPGTTADLVSAVLFVALLEGIIK